VIAEDQGATDIGSASYTCVAGSGTTGTWTAITTSNTLSAREALSVDVTNTPTTTCDILFCVQYK